MATLAAAVIGTTAMAQDFTLKSSEIGAEGQMPRAMYATDKGFDGEDQSPQLHWENAPKGTKFFAVTIFDKDAPTGHGFWHWVIFDIPSHVHELKAGAGDLSKNFAPAGSVQSMTDAGKPGYVGAAPAVGPPVHRYVITVYATDKKLELDEKASPAVVEAALAPVTLAKSSLLVYGRR